MDLGDLCGIGVEMAARKGIGVDDETLEDAAIRHHVLYNADPVSVTVIDGGSGIREGDNRPSMRAPPDAPSQRQVRTLIAEA